MSLNDYENFQPPRNDNSFMDSDISLETNLFVRLKKYIIALRRKGSQQLFNEFRELYESNQDLFLKELKIRQIVSILDTYADGGNDLESGLALTASTLANCEKIHLSLFVICSVNFKHNININTQINSAGIHSLNSIRFAYDDAVLNWLNRCNKKFSKSAVLKRLWSELLKHSYLSDYTLLATLKHGMGAELKADTEMLLKGLLTAQVLDDHFLDTISKKSFEWK